MTYDRNMSGVLFKNDRRTSETQPLYKGSCTINGIEYWQAAWLRKKKDTGEQFMSFTYEPKEPKSDVIVGDSGTDEIPF